MPPARSATLHARTDTRARARAPRPIKLDTEGLEATLDESLEVLSGALTDLLRLSARRGVSGIQRRALVEAVRAVSLADRHTLTAIHAVQKAGGHA